MAEYISREAVLKCIENDGYEGQYDLGYYAHNSGFQELIGEIPAADVVEVVRCKDCIYSRFDLDMSEKAAPWLLCKMLRDEIFPLMVAKTDYCCWAERKED